MVQSLDLRCLSAKSCEGTNAQDPLQFLICVFANHYKFSSFPSLICETSWLQPFGK